MKVLLQDSQNDRYLAAGGTWTTLPREAKDFRSRPYACAMARQQKLLHLRVVLYFEDYDYTIKARSWQTNGRLMGDFAFGV